MRAGLDVDSNVVALGFILMLIVLLVAAWGWCVRRTKQHDELRASLVEDNPGYVAPHKVLSAGGGGPDYADPAADDGAPEAMGLHPMTMSRSSPRAGEPESGAGHVHESRVDSAAAAHPDSNPFAVDSSTGHI